MTSLGLFALFALYAALGVGAGTLTTVAGQGGGLLLLLACAALVGPREALAITSPALLLGNLHRSILLRRHIDVGIAGKMIAGALPGGLLGGMLAGVIPTWALRGLLIGMTTLAIAKALKLVRFEVSSKALVLTGVLVGAMTGTAGGAGVLFAPVLFSSGLSGSAFVATASAIALATHIGRVLGYASQGMFERNMLLPSVAIALAIFVGNALGDRLRSFIAQRTLREIELSKLLEYGVLVVCVALSVAGLG